MKAAVIIVVFAFFSAGCCLPTITVGDFISPPVWTPGKWPESSFGRSNFPGASWVNGVGIMLKGSSPVLIFKNDNGTYSSVEPAVTCSSRQYTTTRRATTNGRVFLCLQTVFEIDESGKVVYAQNLSSINYDRARIMDDDSIVWLSTDDGHVHTYAKVNGTWTEVASYDVFRLQGFSITDNWMVYYGTTTYIATRGPEYTWNVTTSFTTNDRFKRTDPLVYTGGESILTTVLPFSFTSAPRQYIKTTIASYQYDIGQDTWASTTNLTQDSLGSDFKPVGALGLDLLYIDDNTVIASAPFDNYNFTRVQNGGSAFVLRRQVNDTWQFESKFVQATDDARLHQAIGYDAADGRLYFYACRTGYLNNDLRLARNECGFKYAEWYAQ